MEKVEVKLPPSPPLASHFSPRERRERESVVDGEQKSAVREEISEKSN